MFKVLTGNTLGIGGEIKLRNYSEPLQSQKELTSYGTNILYPMDFGLEDSTRNLPLFENQLIQIWRAMSKNPYIDFAIDDIVNEMVSYSDEHKYPILLNLNETTFSKKIRKLIQEEWINIMKLLDFDRKAYTYLRDWYIDGKQYFYVEYEDKGRKGIQKIISLDPVRTKVIVDEQTKDEYFVYMDIELNNVMLKIDKNFILEANSGLMDDWHNIWISYLNKAYIPLNQLNSLEDAALIYKIARAPERRVFYIDVGQLPKSKAETYMKEVIRNCRNKVEYDPTTGTIKESALHMSLLDDIYLPRSAEGRSTEVSTLQGGNSSIGNLDDLNYFKMKLFRALNVPFTRWSELNNNAQSLGRTNEITRDELKYRKFIIRLRQCYEMFFYNILRLQLRLKNIVTAKEFDENVQHILFIWISDSLYTEFRDMEILAERLTAAGNVEGYIGRYYSNGWVRRNILKQTDEDIRQLDAEMEEEEVKKATGENGADGGVAGVEYSGSEYGDTDDINKADAQNAVDAPEPSMMQQKIIVKPEAPMPVQAMMPGVDPGAYQRENILDEDD